MIFSQSDSEFINYGTISDGVVIAAARVRLVNADSGRIIGAVSLTAGGSEFINELGGIVRSANPDSYSETLVMGSAGADRVVNAGAIRGLVLLGDGDDQYVDRDGSNYGTIDLGTGNDIYRVEGSSFRVLNANGGDGWDKVVLANTHYQMFGNGLMGFEELIFEYGGNYEQFSGFQKFSFTDISPAPFYNLIDCLNPLADVSLNGQFLTLQNSSVRSVTGSDQGESLELGAGASVLQSVSLGAGNDGLVLWRLASLDQYSVGGTIDGGSGHDSVLFYLTGGADLTFDMSGLTGFEEVRLSSDLNKAATLRLDGLSGFDRFQLEKGVTLVLSNSSLPDANVAGMFGSNFTLGAGSLIGRYGPPPEWYDSGEQAQGDDLQSSTFVNNGTVTGDVRFYTGDDTYDGRNGNVGGTIYGNAGNDTLLGGSAAERIDGGYGADVLSGGGGADTLVGGAGRDTFRDTVAGLSGDTITDFGVGDRIVLTDATLAGFTASLSGSVLSFTGGTINVSPTAGRLTVAAAAEGGVQITLSIDADHDFDGNGKSDIALLKSDGSLVVWRAATASGGFVENGALAANALGTSWKIAGLGDFNGDGRDDILWRHSSGEIGEWLGQTGVFTNNGGAAANPVDNSWSVVGIADYNGDGRDDILWRHSSGEVGQWLAQPNGGFANNGGAAANKVDNGWKVLASGDFNGDGRADILWQHTSGVYAVWKGTASGALVNAGSVMNGALGTVVGSGDFNGDGRDDILLRNSISGQIAVWLGGADGQFTKVDPLRQLIDFKWKIASIGDFTGDGKADILWQHSSGATAIWSGAANGEFDYGGSGPTVPADHVIQSPDLWLI